MLVRTRKVQNGGVEKGLVFTALTAQVRMQVMLLSECYLEYEELRPFEKLKFIHPGAEQQRCVDSNRRLQLSPLSSRTYDYPHSRRGYQKRRNVF